MKRFISLSLSLVVALTLFLSIGVSVSAQAPPGVDVEVGIVTGGDATLGVDVTSGGDTYVSINGEGLATASTVASAIDAASPRGTEYDLFTHLEVRRLSERSGFVDGLLGLLTEGLALNIVGDQERAEAINNQLTVIGFEQDSQDFLISLNRANIVELAELISGLDTRCSELDSALAAEIAYRQALITHYTNQLQTIFMVGALILAFVIGTLVYLLLKVRVR